MSQAELPDCIICGLFGSKLAAFSLLTGLTRQHLLARSMDKERGLLLFFRLYLTLKCESPL